MREYNHVARAIGAIVVRLNFLVPRLRELRSKRLFINSFISRSAAYTSLGKLFNERQHFETKKEETTDEAITAIDFEEQEAGYQAAFSRLAASESAEIDLMAYVPNPLLFLQQELERLTSKYGQQQVQMLISVAEGGQIA